MSSTEAAIREFALTGDETIASYRANLLNIAKAQTAIRTLTQDNPNQQAQFPTLRSWVPRRSSARRDHRPASHRWRGGGGSAFRVGIGRQLMNAFQATVGNMQNEERRLLMLRDVDAERS